MRQQWNTVCFAFVWGCVKVGSAHGRWRSWWGISDPSHLWPRGRYPSRSWWAQNGKNGISDGHNTFQSRKHSATQPFSGDGLATIALFSTVNAIPSQPLPLCVAAARATQATSTAGTDLGGGRSAGVAVRVAGRVTALESGLVDPAAAEVVAVGEERVVGD